MLIIFYLITEFSNLSSDNNNIKYLCYKISIFAIFINITVIIKINNISLKILYKLITLVLI